MEVVGIGTPILGSKNPTMGLGNVRPRIQEDFGVDDSMVTHETTGRYVL